MDGFLIDENLPNSLARDLVERGHRAVHVRELGLGGSSDDALLAHAITHRLAIITCDLGFSDKRRLANRPHFGIMVVRLADEEPIDERRRRILSVIGELADEDLQGALIIIDPGGVRLRRSSPRDMGAS